MSLFISFEGIEGCGKTTQAELLSNYLKGRGYHCLLTREPGGTRIGDQIRAVLLHSANSDLTLKTELFLYLASRAQHVDEVIIPALKKGKVVICDRFADSTIVYQGLVQGIDLGLIETLNRTATSGIAPDLTLFVDCPVETGLKRARRRIERKGLSLDDTRFEEKEMDFHYRVRSGYLDLSRKEPDRIKVVDGNQDIMSIHREVVSLVSEKLGGDRG